VKNLTYKIKQARTDEGFSTENLRFGITVAEVSTDHKM